MIIDPLNMVAALKARKEAYPYGEGGSNNASHDAIDPSSKGDFALTRDMMRYDPFEVQDFHDDQQFRPMPETISMRSQQHSQMPFPDNHDPRMDFVNRWPAQLPPSGIMNDLKPQMETGPELARKLMINSLRGPNG